MIEAETLILPYLLTKKDFVWLLLILPLLAVAPFLAEAPFLATHHLTPQNITGVPVLINLKKNSLLLSREGRNSSHTSHRSSIDMLRMNALHPPVSIKFLLTVFIRFIYIFSGYMKCIVQVEVQLLVQKFQCLRYRRVMLEAHNCI